LHHKKDILLATWYYQESLQQKKKKSSSPVTRRNSPKNRSRRLTRRKTVRDVKITENTLCSNSSSNISSGVFNLSPEQRKSKQMIHPISSCPQLEKMSLAS
jgi:hypothetical protein